MIASSGSSTSPLPETISDTVLSATAIMASSRRRYRSVRQSLASSTQARESWPGCCSSLASSRSKSVSASAVAPAKPASTLPPPSRRSFFAFDLSTVWPKDTWPSPAITTLPSLRSDKIVVPCQVRSLAWDMRAFRRDGHKCGLPGGCYQAEGHRAIEPPRRRGAKKEYWGLTGGHPLFALLAPWGFS